MKLKLVITTTKLLSFTIAFFAGFALIGLKDIAGCIQLCGISALLQGTKAVVDGTKKTEPAQ